MAGDVMRFCGSDRSHEKSQHLEQTTNLFPELEKVNSVNILSVSLCHYSVIKAVVIKEN